MDFLFELLIQLVIDVIGQLLVEGLFELGLESLVGGEWPERGSSPFVSAVRHLLLGAFTGAISLFVLPHRLVPYSPVPGLSLILSPLGNGIVMHLIGRRWNDRPSDRPALFTFGAGFLFGFGMALVRFVWLR